MGIIEKKMEATIVYLGVYLKLLQDMYPIYDPLHNPYILAPWNSPLSSFFKESVQRWHEYGSSTGMNFQTLQDFCRKDLDFWGVGLILQQCLP